MNLGQSIRSSVKWLVVGTFGSRIMTFGFGIALARLLVPDDFGVLATIRVFTGFAGMLMSAGMGQSLIRAKEADESDFNSVFTMQLAMSIVIYLSFFWSAPLISAFFERPVYTSLIRASTLVFLLRPFLHIRIAWLSRKMNFKDRSIANIVAGVISNSSAVMMAFFGFGVWSLILSGLLDAFATNLMLTIFVPLRLKPVLNIAAMRRHSSYGFKITVNEFLGYLTRESRNLILSKLAGASFLGLFNKSESLAKLPNEMFMSATMQPVFRGLSEVQDDLDKTKYMLYRVITLLMVYTIPIYVILWWISGPFIEVVYGPKWLAVIEPLRILVIAGFFFNILFPCSRLLDAQNLLWQEMVVLVGRLVVVTTACIVGLRWGLEGVAWGVLIAHIFAAVAVYYLVYRALPTRVNDLVKAITPGVVLNSMLFLFLAVCDFSLRYLGVTSQAVYLMLLTIFGAGFYGVVFLLMPIASMQGEQERWMKKINGGVRLAYRGISR